LPTDLSGRDPWHHTGPLPGAQNGPNRRRPDLPLRRVRRDFTIFGYGFIYGGITLAVVDAQPLLLSTGWLWVAPLVLLPLVPLWMLFRRNSQITPDVLVLRGYVGPTVTLPWARIQAIGAEPSGDSRMNAYQAEIITAVYDDEGRRRELPWVDDRTFGDDLVAYDEVVKDLWARWEAGRGADWQPQVAYQRTVSEHAAFGMSRRREIYFAIGGALGGGTVLLVAQLTVFWWLPDTVATLTTIAIVVALLALAIRSIRKSTKARREWRGRWEADPDFVAVTRLPSELRPRPVASEDPEPGDQVPEQGPPP
jgi:hypothetical protein